MTDLTVANEILRQLGGNRFIAMTGAKDFAGTVNSLRFRIPRSKGINIIKIELNSMDEYDLTFSYVHGAKATLVEEITGIYNDQLQEIFTRQTGLYTTL